MGRIVSFRGQLNMGVEERIPLSTNKGLIGYKVKKFQILSSTPGVGDVEYIAQIYKTEDAANINTTPDFSDNRLIAVSYSTFGNQPYEVTNSVVVFDQEIFNQDIYITYIEASGSNRPMNYYLELEVVKLNESEAMVATLKDIRNNS